MITLFALLVSQPKSLQWWQWGMLIGFTAPIVLVVMGITNGLIWAIALHLLMDFTVQSEDTAAKKPTGDLWTLVYHSFLSGGYAGLAAGGFEGLLFSTVIHFLVDHTNKFGLKGPAGPALDQASHVITLVLIYICF